MFDSGPPPLAGLRVLDSADEKGELCGRILADLGADVLRLEPPEGALSRRLPPFAPGGGTSLYFAFRNAGKRGLSLDLRGEADRRRLHELLDHADVWIESGRPGELAALGLAPEELLARHPHLVLTSISDFGQTGPYRDYLGTDMIGFAMGGLMHRSGAPHRPPLVAPGALAYDSAGVTAGYATLLAYWQRLATGAGQHVDVSVYESVANLSDWAVPNWSAVPAPQVAPRMGAGFYPLYRCADGWVRMIILVKHHWRTLLDWMGNPEALADPALDQFVVRLVRQQEINPVVEAFFRDQPKVEVACEAQRRGIPTTPLLTPGEVIDNEHTRARGTFRTLELAPGVVAQVASGFFEIEGERLGPRTRAPLPGEDAGGFREAGRREAVAQRVGHGAAPFAGLRVIDFGVGAVGVEVGRLLAEYGADVVKIESARAPDFIRVILSSWMNPSFASSSRSKRSFGVNLKTPRGLELMHALVREADVFVENNGTGVMQRLGLDAETLRRLNPRIISFSSQMVGSSGPWAHWIGYGPSTHPVSGLQWLWNYPEDVDRPAGSTNVYPDHLVGRVGALAVVAGLIRRERTGTGMHAEAAQFESAIQLLGDLFAQESLEAGSVRPQGNASSRGAPWGAYPCAGNDAWCAITVRDDAEWRALCRVLGEPPWCLEPALATADGRRAARERIDAELGAWTAQRDARKVMEELQAAGVPCGMLQNPSHQIDEPHLAARGYLRPVDQPDLGRVVFEGPAFRGSALPDADIRPAPLLGEHTRELARERLGLAEEEIEALIREGVLEDPPE